MPFIDVNGGKNFAFCAILVEVPKYAQRSLVLIFFFLTSCAQTSSEPIFSNPWSNPDVQPSPEASPSSNPGPEGTLHGPPKITFLSSCEYGSIFYCLGGFGFSVYEDGSYQIGPAPNNQVLTNKLDTEDFNSIAEIFHDESTPETTNNSIKVCFTPPYPIEVTMDKVSIETDGPQTRLIQTVEGDLCVIGILPTRAVILYPIMKSLASKYYPLPFTVSCLEWYRAGRVSQKAPCSVQN